MEEAQKELEDSQHLDPQQAEHLQGLVRYAGAQLATCTRATPLKLTIYQALAITHA